MMPLPRHESGPWTEEAADEDKARPGQYDRSAGGDQELSQVVLSEPLEPRGDRAKPGHNAGHDQDEFADKLKVVFAAHAALRLVVEGSNTRVAQGAQDTFARVL